MRFVAILICVLGISTFYSRAEDTKASHASYLSDAVINIQLENDFFSGVDADYTNGVSLMYISQGYGKGRSSANHGFSAAMARGVGSLLGGTKSPRFLKNLWGVKDDNDLQEQWGLTLTQLMYTPEDKSSAPIYTERTYAGYLALGIGGMVKDRNRATVLELQMGTTGSASLAKQTQHFVHQRLNMIQWPGWDNQIPSEFAFCFFLKRYYRMEWMENKSKSGFWESDGFVYWHTDLGTVYLRGGVGFMYRWGHNLPASSAEIAIAGATFPTSPFSQTRSNASKWSYYLYGGMVMRAIGWDIFLDGPVFHSSYPEYAEKRYVVGDITAGIGIRYKNTELLVGYLVRSKEYHDQQNFQTLGTCHLRYSF